MTDTSFDFATATRIAFGRGRVRELPQRVAALGKRVFVVSGSCPERIAEPLRSLQQLGLDVSTFTVSGEPSIEVAHVGCALARECAADVVIALGGGSVLDAGKAIAALSTNEGSPLDYLEVIGKGQPLLQPALPFVAVPTTSGTGAEVTKNAVLASKSHGVKVSLRSDSMLPRLALVDPELTLSVPPAVTATTGLDALTQVIEPYLSCQANPMTDAIALAGIGHACQGLRRAFDDGTDVEARTHMSLASLFGGLALANAKLGSVHGIAGPLGGMIDAAHGALCARLLPVALRVNWTALNERAPAHPTVARMASLARLLTGEPTATPMDGIAWLDTLVTDLAIPSLSTMGLTSAMIPTLVAASQRASSMKGNPIPLTDAEVRGIVEACS